MQRVVVKDDLVNTGIGSKMMVFCEDLAQSMASKLFTAMRVIQQWAFILRMDVAEGDYFDEDTIPHLKMRKTFLKLMN